MQKLKRGFASLLILAMLISTLPLGVLAAEAEAQEGTRLEAEAVPEAPQASEAPQDEVTFSCQNVWDGLSITVTSDESKLDAEDEDGNRLPYVPFEEDGGFTIPLDAGTAFPVVVNFTFGERSFFYTFGNKDDSTEVGGHTFTVFCEEAPEPEDPALEPEEPAESDDSAEPAESVDSAEPEESVFPDVEDEVYVRVDGQPIPLTPADSPALLSMMPLEVRYYDLDLQGYLPYELRAMDISDLLAKLTPRRYHPDEEESTQNPDEVAAWIRWYYYDEEDGYVTKNDNYTIVGADKTIDCSDYDWYNGFDNYHSSYMELIIGRADPLDKNNTRYIVYVKTAGLEDIVSAEVYSTSNPRQRIEINRQRMNNYHGEKTRQILYMYVNPKDWQTGQEAYLSLNLNSRLSGLTARVYQGLYETEEALTGAREITSSILNQKNLASEGGWRNDYSYKRGYEGMPEATLVLTRESTGKTALILPMVLYMQEDSLVMRMDLYAKDKDGRRLDIWDSYDNDNEVPYDSRIVLLKPGYPEDETYFVNLELYPRSSYSSSYGKSYVKKAVIGYYDSEKRIPAEAEDVKEELFSDTGYSADFSKGVVFTVVDTYDSLHWMKIRTVEGEEKEPVVSIRDNDPLSEDTYFRMEGALESPAEEEGYERSLNAYVMPYTADSYYYNGFQTVLLLDGEGEAVSGEILPVFDTHDGVEIFAGRDKDGTQAGAEKQESGVSKITFENNKAILYSAAAENGSNLKNYWVTFLTKQPGKELFVNGINDSSRKDKETGYPVREVLLTEYYGNHHDVFFANIGSETLTDLSVELLDAQYVKLDEYWKIHETTELDPFTTTERTEAYGELSNVSKIRLVPIEKDGKIQPGVVSGILKITAKDIEPIYIKLIGTAGPPQIITESVMNGVKYVHYSCLIQTNNMYGTNRVEFSQTGGKLPEGMELKPNGELYGVPKENGTFTFTATAKYEDRGETRETSREFTFTIANNSDEYVEAVNTGTQGYALLDRVADLSGVITENQLFRSEGAFSEFMNVYLDGKMLTKDVDYTVKEGSTAITFQAKTMQQAGEGTHTISAEFRSGASEQGTMKRTAQNFKISEPDKPDTPGTPGTPGKPGKPSGSGGVSSSGSGSGRPGVNPNKPSTSTPTQTETPKTTADIFRDISTANWFYPDVDWAYQNGLMVGVTESDYQPYGSISPATVVVVLARLNKADLTQWQDNVPEEVTPGQWYTAAASWAKAAGLLPDGPFEVGPSMPRGQMAVMLKKYLVHLGIDCTLPSQPVAFTDAALMTQEENDAFQVLYQFGIFKGIGNYTMDVAGSTTRAQFAVLLHRLSVFVAAHQAQA